MGIQGGEQKMEAFDKRNGEIGILSKMHLELFHITFSEHLI